MVKSLKSNFKTISKSYSAARKISSSLAKTNSSPSRQVSIAREQYKRTLKKR